MTLTLAQRDKIYAGIPGILGAVTLRKQESGQLVNPPTFPALLVSFVTEGIPVRPRMRLRTVFDPANECWHETFGEQCKASISCVLETTNKRQLTELADLFCHSIQSTELGINPYDDLMEFRGCDPPKFLDPYFIEQPNGRIAVYRCVIDFFVEYEFSWTYDRSLIKEIDIQAGGWTKEWVKGSGGPIDLVSKVNLASFSLDIILAR